MTLTGRLDSTWRRLVNRLSNDNEKESMSSYAKIWRTAAEQL
jgi:hypothetical protein